MRRTSSIAALVATLFSSAGFDAARAAEPAYTQGHFVFAIDGETALVPRVSGGGIRAEVETTEVDGAISKQVVGVVREDVVVDLDLAAMPGSLADWIVDSWEQRYERRTGSTASWFEIDDSGKALQARELFEAHITEVRFPRLDASSVEPESLQIRISPEGVENLRAPAPSAAPAAPKQKKWMPSNFRFTLGSLPTANVIQVDEIVVRPPVDGDDSGAEIPNFEVRFAAVDAGAWVSWFESFVIDGKCADGDELDGQITILGPDHTEVLGRIELERVGIVSLSLDEAASFAAGFPVMQAEIYVEDMKLFFDRVDS